MGVFKFQFWYPMMLCGFLLAGMVATLEPRFSLTYPLQNLQSSILETNVKPSDYPEMTSISQAMMEHGEVLKTLGICLELHLHRFARISMELYELASCMADQFPETKMGAKALLFLDGIKFYVQDQFRGSMGTLSISPTWSFDMSKTEIGIFPTSTIDVMSTAEVKKSPINGSNMTVVQIIGSLQALILEAQKIVQQEIEPLKAMLTDCIKSNYTSVNETEELVPIQKKAENYTINIKSAMTFVIETINALQVNMTGCTGTLDCNGKCNGTARLHEICSDISYGGSGTEAEFLDCNETLEMKAIGNTCYVCVSKKKKDACGVCGGDNSTCKGCDGVLNSGKVENACGVCGGNNTQCPRVDSVEPFIIPNIIKNLTVIGATFDFPGLKFILQNESSKIIPTRELVIINAGTATFVVPTLLPGTYKVHSMQGLEGKLSNSSATLKVYDKNAVNTTGVTQDTDVIGDSLTSTVKIAVTQIKEGPVYCIVKGLYLNHKVFNGTLTAVHISCDIDVPIVSAHGTIFASLNKQDLIGLGHQITYYAKAPVVVSLAFDSTGQFIILTFNTDVSTQALDTCDKILSNVSKLGTNPKCTWISARELKILLPSDATILNGDTLTLVKGIKAARQFYGKEAGTGPNPVLLSPTEPTPVLVIKGPEEVGSCQINVSYKVSILKGLGSRPFKSIVWSLNKDGVRNNSALNVMEFTTQLIEVGVYEVNATVTNFLNISSTATLNVTKTNQTKPIAILDTDLEKSTEGLPIIRLNKGFSAWTNVIFGVGCEKGTITFKWKLDDVVLNSTQRLVKFEAFSIPNTVCGKTVTLAVSVTLNSLAPVTVTGVAKVVCRKPVPVITGGGEVEVGVRSGQITIDGSKTFDPENAEVTYKWECLQGPASSAEEPTDPCISQLPSESVNITFPTDREKNETKLIFDAARFKAGNKYKFTLTASSVKGGTTFSETISAMYTAVEGNMPLVEILTTLRKFRKDEVIIIKAGIKSSVQVVTEWSFVEDSGFDTRNITAVGTQTLRTGAVTSTYISQLEIGKDTLSAGAKYKVKLSVSHVSDSSVVVETCKEIAIYEDLMGCTINARDYGEYDMTAIEFFGCVTDSEGYPLTYTLQLGSQILGTTMDTILKIPGPPLEDRTLTKARFTVIVRNSVGQVKTFESREVTVTKKSKKDAAAAAESLITEAEKTGDIVTALTLLHNKIISLETSGTTDVQKALTLIKDIRENQLSPMNARQALEVQSQLDTAIFSEDEKKEAFTHQKSFLRELISDKTQSYTTEEVRKQLVHAQKLAHTTDDEKTLRETASMITALAVRDKGLNDPVEVTVDEKMTFVKIIKTKLNEKLSTKTNEGANFEFPSELQERFSNWACGDMQDCEGVAVLMTTYDASNNTFGGDTTRKCTDIIEMDLVNPVSGETQEVTGLKQPIEMELPLTQSCGTNADTKTKCYYYDPATKKFKLDGLTTKSVSANVINCTTNHLTAFTSFSELTKAEQSNTAIIVGTVIGGLVLITIVIVIVVVIVKKKSKVHSEEYLHR